MSERGSGFGGFLLGVVVGAVVGLLFAPEAGEGTRHKLSRRLRDLRDAAEELSAGGEPEPEPEEGEESPRSAREELERRLQAARRRRRQRSGAAEVAAEHDEEDEPVA